MPNQFHIKYCCYNLICGSVCLLIVIANCNCLLYCVVAFFLWGKFWHESSLKTKQSLNLNQFKTRIKSWKAEEYSCHSCRYYEAQIGFIS